MSEQSGFWVNNLPESAVDEAVDLFVEVGVTRSGIRYIKATDEAVIMDPWSEHLNEKTWSGLSGLPPQPARSRWEMQQMLKNMPFLGFHHREGQHEGRVFEVWGNGPSLRERRRDRGDDGEIVIAINGAACHGPHDWWVMIDPMYHMGNVEWYQKMLDAWTFEVGKECLFSVVSNHHLVSRSTVNGSRPNFYRPNFHHWLNHHTCDYTLPHLSQAQHAGVTSIMFAAWLGASHIDLWGIDHSMTADGEPHSYDLCGSRPRFDEPGMCYATPGRRDRVLTNSDLMTGYYKTAAMVFFVRDKGVSVAQHGGGLQLPWVD